MYKKVDSKLLQIGNNVREYRKQKHYNQEKLAELLDVSVATVSRIENGYFDSYEYFKDIRTAN